MRNVGLMCAVIGAGALGCASGSSELTGASSSGDGRGGGGDDSGTTTGVGGGFTSGSGGGGGSAPACSPGETESCFSGPMEALGVGICAGGTRTCIADGEFGTWGPCEDEQLPLQEECDEASLDEDCNGQQNEVCSVCNDGDIQSCGIASACDFQLCVSGQWSACGAASPVVLTESFEAATSGEGWPAPTMISAFTVVSGDVDVMHDPAGLLGPSHDGAQAIDLNGWSPGAMSTTLNTTPGATYLMRFAYTKNPSPQVPNPTGAEVVIDGTQALAVTAAQMNNYSNLMWECAVLKFTATSATTSVEIGSTTNNPSNGGVYVDSILITQP